MFGIFSKSNKIKKSILTHQINYNLIEKEIHEISKNEYFGFHTLVEEITKARLELLRAKQNKLIAVIDLLRYELKDTIIKDFDGISLLDKFPESRGYVYETEMRIVDIKPFCDEILYMNQLEYDYIKIKKDEIEKSNLIEPIKKALLYKQRNKEIRLAKASSRLFQRYFYFSYVVYNNLRKYKDCSSIILCLSDIDYIAIADMLDYYAKKHKVNVIVSFAHDI